jgi:hypothetical protein
LDGESSNVNVFSTDLTLEAHEKDEITTLLREIVSLLKDMNQR